MKVETQHIKICGMLLVQYLVLMWKYVALISIRKGNRSEICDLSFYLKKLEKDQIKTKISRRKRIIKREETNRNQKSQRNMNKTKS